MTFRLLTATFRSGGKRHGEAARGERLADGALTGLQPRLSGSPLSSTARRRRRATRSRGTTYCASRATSRRSAPSSRKRRRAALLVATSSSWSSSSLGSYGGPRWSTVIRSCPERALRRRAPGSPAERPASRGQSYTTGTLSVQSGSVAREVPPPTSEAGASVSLTPASTPPRGRGGSLARQAGRTTVLSAVHSSIE